MSILDSVINPVDFEKLDPNIRTKIFDGVMAGAKVNAALEAKQRFSPAISKPLSADAKTAVTNFRKTMRK